MADPIKKTPNPATPVAATKTTEAETAAVPPIGAAALADERAENAASTPSKAEAAKERAEAAKETVSEQARDFAEEARVKAAEAADRARLAAFEQADSFKDRAGDEIDARAQGIRNAGRELGKDGYPAQAADYLAQSLTEISDAIRSRDMRGVVDDVTHFARRNPALFLGGAALAGFALSRMMKASDRSQAHYPSPAVSRPRDDAGTPDRRREWS